MKNLKLATAFLCLFGLFSFSVIFTSCGKDVATTPIDYEPLSAENGLLIPTSVYEQGKEYYNNYIENATNEQMSLMQNDFVAAKYLQDIGKIQEIGNTQEGDFHFSKLDFSKYLNQEQISILQTKLSVDESVLMRDYCLVTVWQNGQWYCCYNWCTGGGC